MKESRTEIRKVVWPTRMETTQTFMVVFASIVVLCLFFWGLESLLSFLTGLGFRIIYGVVRNTSLFWI
jgi:preprotein translocase subunit SecE